MELNKLSHMFRRVESTNNSIEKEKRGGHPIAQNAIVFRDMHLPVSDH